MSPIAYALPRPLTEAVSRWESTGAEPADLHRSTRGLPCGHTVADPIEHVSAQHGPLHVTLILLACCVCQRLYWDGTLEAPHQQPALAVTQ